MDQADDHAQQEPKRRAPMMMGVGSIVLTLLCMWPFWSKDWRAAEKVWRAGMAAEGNPQAGRRRHDWLPYGFLTRTGTTNIYRIVHKGRLLPLGGGVDALATYLRDIDAFGRGKLKVTDMRELLETFGANAPSDDRYAEFIDPLAPKLSRTRDKIELVVFCPLREPEERHTRPRPPDTQDVEKWTLTVDRQHAAWTKEMIKVKRATMEPL